MRGKSLIGVGIFSLLAATAALGTSNSFAAGAQRVDVIESLPTGAQAQWDSLKPAAGMRVDVIESIESQGPVYPSTSDAMRVDVIEGTRS